MTFFHAWKGELDHARSNFAWELSRYLSFNMPNNPDYSGPGWQIAGQQQKVFKDPTSMQKYLHGRIKAYAYLSTEISPPKMNIPLTHEERCEVGRLYLTKGFETAVSYVKHVERTRERLVTYGFHVKETPGRFAYCPQLYFRSDAPIDERLSVFKRIRSVLAETDGRVVVSTECDLDGGYNPVNVRERTETADLSRPLRIPMGEKIIRKPPRPHSKAPQKARPKKHRGTAPGR